MDVGLLIIDFVFGALPWAITAGLLGGAVATRIRRRKEPNNNRLVWWPVLVAGLIGGVARILS